MLVCTGMNEPIIPFCAYEGSTYLWMIYQLRENQLIPQIIINYRRHNTIGLQPSMMMLWAWAGVPLGVYNITKNFNVALRIQPQILTLLSLITWTQCRYYDKVRIEYSFYYRSTSYLLSMQPLIRKVEMAHLSLSSCGHPHRSRHG